jgi:hypothetical protein
MNPLNIISSNSPINYKERFHLRALFLSIKSVMKQYKYLKFNDKYFILTESVYFIIFDDKPKKIQIKSSSLLISFY